MSVLPYLLMLAGVAMRVYAGRATFNRRNEYGAEVFNSYGHMKSRRGFEGFIRFFGLLLILAGIGQALKQSVVHATNETTLTLSETA